MRPRWLRTPTISTRNPPQSVGEALEAAAQRLRAPSGPEPAAAHADARILLAHALGRDAAWLLAHGRDTLDATPRATFEAALARRAAGEPVAYIVGAWGFYGRTFAVDRNVLVPRPETELAIGATLEFARGRALDLLDVGTGSGAIALTLALELPQARVTATDASGAALAVARRNAGAFGLGERVAFLEGDLLAPLAAGTRFDVAIANLPYVATTSLATPPDPTSFEPRLALDGGADGHVLYRRLLRDLPAWLSPGALVLLETGPTQAVALAGLTRSALPGATVTVLDDLGGRPRLVRAALAE